MKYEIKSRFTGAVLFALETDSLKLCVEKAVKSGANLSGVDLSGVDLFGANLSGANLSGAVNAEIIAATTNILPGGDLIGWKKLHNGAIAKLSIPAEARRSNATGRKCRAEFADVLEIIGAEEGRSPNPGKVNESLVLTYRAGQRVTPDQWDENRWNECSHGIHFYIARVEAENA